MPKTKEPLTSLPNIGMESERWLAAAGISTPSQLRRLGSVEAAARVNRALGPKTICRSALSAFEGAIRGVRWHAIPKDERELLWNVLCTRMKRAGREAVRAR
jgi:DNA transformation protein and related proteins